MVTTVTRTVRNSNRRRPRVNTRVTIRRPRPIIVRPGRRPRLVRATAPLLRTNIQNRLKRLKRGMTRPTLMNSNRPYLLGNATSTNPNRPRAVYSSQPLSQAGMAFLKCAFAPPDFTETQVQGVPDNFRGLTLLKKHRLVNSYSLTAGTDYYALLCPVPGIAYFLATTVAGVPPTGATIWTGVPYSDYSTLFGASANTTSDVVNSFRYVSNHMELICTTNQMTWSGSISSFKLPIKLIMKPGGLWTITGLQSTLSTNVNQYTGSLFDGVFSGAYNCAPDFEFVPLLEAQPNARVPDVVVAGIDFGQLVSGASGFTGFDNSMESLCLKISGVTTTNSVIFKTWACVEYTALDNSVVYEYQRGSPPEDERALKLYREIALSLPIGVPVRENADFWQRVLRIIRSISAVGAALPGPYGAISSGVNAVTTGISELVF